MTRYNSQKIEPNWQKIWEKEKLDKAVDFSKKPKYYCLIEFPYPSGDGLHVGHPRSYTALDILARKRRMEGYNVLYPIGFDAFGLPSENYAIQTGIHPAITTEKNIKTFTRQLKSLGFSFDWSRQVVTTDPKYYKWTQWIFLKMFEQGLAYKAKMPINWCLSCKIGLANEEVVGGRCERCGGEIEKREKEQWMLKITKYADRLIDDLDSVDYLEKIKTQQLNWIGRSEGATVTFPVIATPNLFRGKQSRGIATSPRFRGGPRNDNLYTLQVFTTRPDTLFGATFMVLAPEHPLILNLESRISNLEEVKKYINQAKKKSDLERTELAKEKTGVELKGVKAINPVNKEKIPIWVADYVLISYGTGAIMAVPAHDQRDFEFAKKYNLPIREVVRPEKSSIKSCLIVHGRPSYDRSKEQGYLGEENQHWIPWLRKQLTARGIKVYNPKMPVPWQPVYEDWKREIKNLDINENSVLVGHSAGAAFLVRWLGETKKKIKKLILVAPAKIRQGDEKQIILDFYDFKIDPEIKKLADEIVIFTSNNDKKRHQKSAHLYSKEMSAKLIKLSNKGHFTLKDMKTPEFPELLNEILLSKSYEGEGVAINSGGFNGLSTAEFKQKITQWLEKKGLGKKAVNYKLRDWVFSRQHYWGEPIPLVFCPECKKLAENSKFQIPNSKKIQNSPPEADPLRAEKFKIQNLEFNLGEVLNPGWIAIPESQLPVTLPGVKNYQPTNTGESPLAAITNWVNTKCPKCGGQAKRETDTMPNWAGSNWYFLRYLDPKNNRELADKKKLKHWLPVDWYNGGMEHTTLHLLYSRFIYKFLYDIEAVPKECGPEPYKKRTSHGLVLGEGGEKMSKSKGNVVNPDDVVKEFGADTFRVYEMFMGPFDQPIPWDTKGVKGVRRFLEKVWDIYQSPKLKIQNPKVDDKEIVSLLHRTIKKVGDDIETQDYNTAVSAMMIFTNQVIEKGGMNKKTAENFLKILAPFAPHLSEELWQQLGHKDSIFKEKWPTYNESLAKVEEIELVIQVNGKLRAKIKVPADITEQRAEKLARENEKVKKYLEGREIKNVIFVPSRLINFVVK